ncbi:MAG: hypothetical protein RLN62_01795 [Rickettsiales bacterium]
MSGLSTPNLKHTNQAPCVLLIEASSSKTVFFSYRASHVDGSVFLTRNLIDGQTKFVLKGEKIDEYARGIDGKSADGYYQNFEHPVIIEHMQSQDCPSFKLGVLATGGMRDRVANNIAENFYDELQNLFNANQYIFPKEVELVALKTISMLDEARFAWKTIKAENNVDNHAVIDLGGASMQFANGSLADSWPLGKQASAGNLGDDIDICYNDKSSDHGEIIYDGQQCRATISEFLDQHQLTELDHGQYDKFYVISTYYLYFNDICGTYLPEAESNKFSIDPVTLERMQNFCEIRTSDSTSLVVDVQDYQTITDGVCAYWGEDWDPDHPKYHFARYSCFAGNYMYELLKSFGLNDEDDIHVNQADWDLEAAYYLFSLSPYSAGDFVCTQPEFGYGTLL